METRTPRLALHCLAAFAWFLLATSGSDLRAQDQPPPKEGLFRGLRDALLPESPAEAFESTRRLADADRAIARMRDLADDRSDPDVQARALLWLGQYHYGIEAYREAATFFEAAVPLQASPETRSRARFWIRQCRNLLEQEPPEVDVPGSPESITDVLAILAEGDSELRRGNPSQAVRRYLSAQGSAERFRCLAPLYYRVALVLSASTELGEAAGIEWRTVRGWEPEVAVSAERALVASWERPPISTPDGVPVDSTGGGTGAVPAESLRVAGLAGAADSTAATLASESGDEEDTEARASSEPPSFVIQLGAFRDLSRARAAMEGLVQRGLSVRLDAATAGSAAGGSATDATPPEEDRETIYRIYLGREATRDDARALAERLCRGLDYEIVRLGGD